MDQKVIILRGKETSDIVQSFISSEEKVAVIKEDKAVHHELESHLKKGFTVIVDGLFSNPRMLEQILSASAAWGYPCLVFEIGDVELSRKDAKKIDSTKHSTAECIEIILDEYKDWDKEKNYIEGAFVFFIKDDQSSSSNKKILMSLTSYGPDTAFYSGYGGGVDEDETPEEAVVREAKEEADVVVDEKDLKKVAVLTKYTKHIPENIQSVFKLTIFLCDKWDGEVQDLPGMKSKWFDFDKLPTEQMFPENNIVFPLFLEGKLVKMDSSYVKKDGKAELISRDLREVNHFGS